MTEYALYLESGPRRKTTMVHVLDLLGCIAQGPTTEEALEATPEAIRAYLRFLRQRGEQVDPEAPFTTSVAEHVMEGPWLGYGNPAPGFSPDFRPLTAEEQDIYVRRLEWIWDRILTLVEALPPDRLAAEPEGKGRSIYAILSHVASSQKEYARSALGKIEGLSEALKVVEEGPEGAVPALERFQKITAARLEALTGEERALSIERGQTVWTARRALRRMLEHGWEHLREISARLENQPGS
jgi:predicted RNase H-like HicB family nuclease/uncharacterized damage-inducible protein DinB